MQKIRFIHWNKEEAVRLAQQLEALGYEVDFQPFMGRETMQQLKQDLPAAVVIDLSRLPSQGRDVALGLRHFKPTRWLPVIFVEGDPQKLPAIKKLVPESIFTTWEVIAPALQQAINNPPTQVTVPESLFAGYAGTPLPQKLGIKADSNLVLVDAPAGFTKTLGDLPEGVQVSEVASEMPDVVLWFTRSRQAYEQRLPEMVPQAEKGGLWVIWPKKTSGMATDLTQVVVRKLGLAAGLVDFKVCSIDATWTGLRFTKRKAGNNG
jgi:CheY-like chemotaxis protein